MSYRFGKLWHLAIIWAIRKAFQCILKASDFCWQTILDFPQHLRMTHIEECLVSQSRKEHFAKRFNCTVDKIEQIFDPFLALLNHICAKKILLITFI